MASASNASRAETSSAAASSTGTGSGTNIRPTVDVTAITTRDEFLLELGDALGGQASVRPVDSMSIALEQLSSQNKRGQVLVIDTRDVGDIRADIERVHQQAAHAVVLVFTVAETEKQIGAALKGSNVFAVLPIPLDKRKTGAVFEGAMADAVARKSMRSVTERSSSASVSVEPFQAQTDSGSPSDSDSGKSKIGLIVGAGIAVVAVAAGAYFFLGKSNKTSAPPPPTANHAPPANAPAPASQASNEPDIPTPTAETALIKGKVDELLERARLAMRERRYSEPIGDNALLYYRSAAAADPANGEAADGLQRVAGVLASRFDEAMNTGRFDEAGMALVNLKAAAPNDSRIPSFEIHLITAQISKGLADGNLDRVNALIRQAQSLPAISADQINKWKTEASRRQEDAKVQKIASVVSDRIRDGRLLEPDDESAKVYLQQLRDVAPTNATTQRLTRELNAAYMRKAREASLGNRPAEVDRWLTEAKAGGVSATEITAFQKELASNRQKAINAEADRLAQLVRERIQSGRLSDPANDSAAYYITQLQSTDAGNSAITPLSRDLANKFVERARSSAQAGKAPSVVEADLTLAKRWGADPKDIQQVQAAAPSKSTAPRSAAAAGMSAATLAQSLKRTRYVAPEFPSKALTQRVNGSVTVEYVVDASGDPRDVRIVEATPPGVFDKAALTAVKKWHYDPVVVNGAPVEVPVRTAIRFELPK